MLSDWLIEALRNPCEYTHFNVYDGVYEAELSDNERKYLTGLLVNTRNDAGFLEIATKHLGEQVVNQHILARQVPRQVNTRRGEFGEVLISALLQEQFGYEIPVHKLRFKITSGELLPGTDALAIKFDQDGMVTELCFVESKLRTTDASQVAVEAANQLWTDTQENLPAILVFTANVLFMQSSPRFEAIMQYMRDRTSTRDRESHCIGLLWESTTWRETVLANLEDKNIELNNLSVHAIRIQALRSVTDALFGAIGIMELIDDG